MDQLIELVKAMGLFGWLFGGGAVFLVSMVIGQTIITLRKMNIKHAERMAKIQQGIDPGDENTAYKKDEI